MAIHMFLYDDSDADVVLRNEMIYCGMELTDLRRLFCVVNRAVRVCVFLWRDGRPVLSQ